MHFQGREARQTRSGDSSAPGAPALTHRLLPAGLTAATALLFIGLMSGAPPVAIAWAAMGMMFGGAAVAGATVGLRAGTRGTEPRVATGSRPDDGRDDSSAFSEFADAAMFVAPTPEDDHLDAISDGLRAAADASCDAVRILDDEGRITWANRVACARAGCGREVLIGRHAFGAEGGCRVDDEVFERLMTAIATGTAFTEWVTARTYGNRVQQLDLRMRPIIGAGGRRDGWVVVERDITAANEHANLLDLVLDASRSGMWDLDVPRQSARLTANVLRMIGEEPTGGPMSLDAFQDRVHPDDEARRARELQASLADDSVPYEIEFRFGCEGRWTWIRSTGRVVERDAEGNPLRMVGLHFNVDDMHQSVTRARQATQLLNTIIDLVPARIFWKDSDGVYLGANHAYRQDHRFLPMLGRTDADLDLDPKELRRRAVREQRVTEVSTPEPELTEPWRRSDGSQGWRQSACRPLVDDAGEVVGTIWSYQDITELQAVAVQLERACDAAEASNRSKSEFLANMSHEIRTPMTAILGFADILDELTDDDADQRRRAEAVETIRRNGTQLLTILNDILDLSKIEAGRMAVERIPVRPATIVGDVQRLLRVRAEGKNIGLRVDFDGPIPSVVETDPVRLRQILTNVVGNAIKFTETGEVVLTVGRSDDGRRMTFTVRDSGIGMSPDQLAGIFDAFTQADSSTTRRFGGTGLGLRISRSLAAALGGTLSVTSEPDVGSTFTLVIDAAAVPETPSLGPDEAAIEAKEGVGQTVGEDAATPAPRTATTDDALLGCRILLAEDGPDNQRLIGFHLRKAGAEVVIAEDGRLAVTAITDAVDAGTPFDVVLMDVQMPVLDGYEATRELRASGHDLPILALTAHAMVRDHARSLEAGCDDHLTKPIDRLGLIGACVAWSDPEEAARRRRGSGDHSAAA